MTGKVQLKGGPEIRYEIDGGDQKFVTLSSNTINFNLLAQGENPHETLLEELEDIGLKTEYVDVVAVFDSEVELEVQSNSRIIAVGKKDIYPR
jgi:hypothetical protein